MSIEHNFEWSNIKNNINYQKHGFDFNDAKYIFSQPMLIKIDNRKDYNEIRYVGLGNLFERITVIVFTKRNDKIRIISLRKANEKEQKIYWQSIN